MSLRGVVRACLAGPVRKALGSVLEMAGVCVLFRTGGSPGDLVCMNAAAGAIRRAHGLRVIVLTRRPELFRGHSAILWNIGLEGLPAFLARRLPALLYRLRQDRLEVYGIQPPEGVPLEQHVRDNLPCDHLTRLHAGHFALRLPAGPLLPEIAFGTAEARRHAHWLERTGLRGPFALVHSEGKTSYTPNKDWGKGRFAEVVRLLPHIRFVQIGGRDDAPIPGALDLRGATPSLRSLAWLVSRAAFVLCLEGLYNHLAAAFRTPAFVVCSGFAHPELAAYPTSVMLAAAQPPPCAPCWLRTPCPVPGKPCMSELTPESVAATIARRFPPPEGHA